MRFADSVARQRKHSIEYRRPTRVVVISWVRSFRLTCCGSGFTIQGRGFAPQLSKEFDMRRLILCAVVVLFGVGPVAADSFGTGGNVFDIDFVTISGSTNPTSGY